MPAMEDLQQRWAARSERRARHLVDADWPNIRSAWAMLEGRRDALDLGCGGGLVTLRLARAEPKVRFVGVDIRSDAVARARERAAEEGVPNAIFQEADAEALPFPEGAFDVVWVRFLLQHVPDPARVVREAVRVLRPGGQLLAWDWDEALTLVEPESPPLRRLLEARRDYQRREGKETRIGRKLAPLLEEAGLTRVRATLMDWNTTDPGRVWLTQFLGLGAANIRDNPLVREGWFSPEEYGQLVAESRRYLESGGSFVSCGAYLAVGTRPEG